jgi:cyclic-di-GMP phosphodiesterase TipF (flagellum assembly factor)
MTDTVSKLFAQLSPPQIRASEAFLLATSAVLSGSIVAALHHWADVPVTTAILAVLGCISLLIGGNALFRRVNAASAVDAEIAEIRAEIAVLRSARPASSPIGLTPEQPRRATFAGAGSVILTPAAAGRPTALLPAPSSQAAPTRGAVREEQAAIERPAATAPASSVQVQDRTRPTERTSAPQSHAVSRQSDVHEGHHQPVSGVGARAAHARTSEPLARLDRPEPFTRQAGAAPHSQFPSDARIRSMPRGEASARPETDTTTSSVSFDLDAMQSLIERLAAQHTQAAATLREHVQLTASGAADARATTAIPASGEGSDKPALKPCGGVLATLAPRSSDIRPVPAADTDGEVTLNGHITLIGEALAAKRMDVFLEPLVGVGDRKVRHLEFSVRLVTQAGHAYAEDELHRIAAGTGLLAQIDAAKLESAAGVLSRFRANGSRACLFTTISGESLVDDNFANAFADILGPERRGDVNLVLAFAQAEARNFTAAHWATITKMWKFGLAFALADVTDLDTDFELLKAYGFDFIKLDAAVFVEGLPTPGGHIPATDICRHLASLGLNLVLGGTVAE